MLNSQPFPCSHTSPLALRHKDSATHSSSALFSWGLVTNVFSVKPLICYCALSSHQPPHHLSQLRSRMRNMFLHLLEMYPHLTNPSHPRHPAGAVGCCLLLAALSEEEVDFIIVSSAAAQTLLHERRADKVCLCVGQKKDLVQGCRIMNNF